MLTIEHKITGQRVVIDPSRSRYIKMSQGFINMLRLEGRFLKHITLTQTKESYKPRILNSFMMALKKRYGKFLYIWSVEIQEKRFIKYGDKVLHWHCLIGFDYNIGLDFGGEDIRKIVSYWKHGGCEIVPVEKPSVGYLMKYITKALDADVDFKIRRMGCSRIPSLYRQSWKKLAPAIVMLTSKGLPLSQWEDVLDWDHRGGYVVYDYEIRMRRSGLYKKNHKFYPYRHPKSDWSVISKGDLVNVENAGVEHGDNVPF